MPLTNLTVIEGKETIQSRVPEAVESYNAREQIAAPLISIRTGRHLDVDEVLARSLPSLTVKDPRQTKIPS
jgi:hypothetical protein